SAGCCCCCACCVSEGWLQADARAAAAMTATIARFGNAMRRACPGCRRQLPLMPGLFPGLDAGLCTFDAHVHLRLNMSRNCDVVKANGPTRPTTRWSNPRTLGTDARGHQATRASGDWLRPRNAPQISSAVAASATGNTISFTALQPKLT